MDGLVKSGGEEGAQHELLICVHTLSGVMIERTRLQIQVVALCFH